MKKWLFLTCLRWSFHVIYPGVNGILGQSSKGSRVLQGDSGKITGNNRSYRHENVTRVATLL
jgi:hypothetical protein